MRFEWDDQQALENVEKHGASFGEATEVFYDPKAIEDYDVGHSDDEARFAIIGCRVSDYCKWSTQSAPQT